MKSIKRIVFTFIIAVTAVSIFSFSSFALTNDSKAGQVVTASTALNVRASASTSSSIVSKLQKGSMITLISKSNGWWKVEYSTGKYGYCSGEYIQEIKESYVATVNVSSGNLNIRSGPGTSHSIQSKLAKGTGIVVLSKSGDWSKIVYDGTKTGYVSNLYLLTNSSTSYKPVSLSVPRYSQTDSRWSNTLVGSSGQTIGRIGCTTTCLAMTESYRTGTTIYPNQMAQRLSYSSSGSLYWPSTYITSTSAGYLNTIYTQLQRGVPVIIGAKNSSGGAHWVVVTGYIGGSILKASDFTVNDPGTTSRTNLQHLFNEYPNFHRIAYYS